jgi:dolichol-phosphate mannosyltransferase
MKNFVSVILATYNERENISLMIDEVSEVLSDRDFEIIVVDDNSPDKTWEAAEEVSQSDNRVRVIRRLGERGLTSAYNVGINESIGQTLIWLDADFQHPTKLIPILADMVDGGLDAALTSRFQENNQSSGLDKGSNSSIINLQVFLTRILNRLTTILNRLTTRQSQAIVTDWTSGYLAIRREIFNSYELSGSHGDYYMHLMYHLVSKGYRFEEIPYALEKRKFGESKTTASFLEFFVNGIKYLSVLLQIWCWQRATPVKTITRLGKGTDD